MIGDPSASKPAKCGSCMLCCELYQDDGVYETRPTVWKCLWLAGQKMAGMKRPDQSHYVMEVMPQTVTVMLAGAQGPLRMQAFRVWADSKYPLAHRAPEFRAFLSGMNEAYGDLAAVIVWSGTTTTTLLLPPRVTGAEEWTETNSQPHPGRSIPPIPPNQGAPPWT